MALTALATSNFSCRVDVDILIFVFVNKHDLIKSCSSLLLYLVALGVVPLQVVVVQLLLHLVHQSSQTLGFFLLLLLVLGSDLFGH